MCPILFKIPFPFFGPIPIAGYGTMLAIAFMVGYALAIKEFERLKLPRPLIDSLVIWGVVGGLVGSKLWSALEENYSAFIEHPLRVLMSGSGFTAHGGFILAFILGMTAIHFYKKKDPTVSYLKIFDAISPSMAVGYLFGRIGCQLAGDGDYGIPSTLPWAMAYPKGTVPTFDRVHPAPVYEALFSLALFILLWSIRKKNLKPGSLFCIYLIISGLGRFLVEFIRLNESLLLGLSSSQVYSLILMIGGAVGLFVNRFYVSSEPVKS